MKITCKVTKTWSSFAFVVTSFVFANVAVAQASKDSNYVKSSELSYSCGTVKLAYSAATYNASLARLHGEVNIKPQTKAQVLNDEITLDNHPIIKKLVIEAVNRGYYDGLNGAGARFTHQMEESLEGRCRNIVLDNNDKLDIQRSGE